MKQLSKLYAYEKQCGRLYASVLLKESMLEIDDDHAKRCRILEL